MISIETLTDFFGWCTVIGFGLLAFTSIAVIAWGKSSVKIHAKMFNVNEAELPRMYFSYIAHFKIAVIVFNLVPWIALKIIGS